MSPWRVALRRAGRHVRLSALRMGLLFADAAEVREAELEWLRQDREARKEET